MRVLTYWHLQLLLMTHITTTEFIVPGMSGDAVILITVAAAITGGDVIAVGQAALFLRGREDKGTGEHCSGLGELLDQVCALSLRTTSLMSSYCTLLAHS
jgi:hypothetical protein